MRPTNRQIRDVVERVPGVGRPAARLGRAVLVGVGLAPPAIAARSIEGHPPRFRANPTPREITTAWPEPPEVEDPMRVIEPIEPIEPIDSAAAGETTFDVDLFETLNAEYADRPLLAAPPQYDHDSLIERARARLLNVHRSIDLSGKRVLEFGCGGGYEIWSVSHHFGSQGWGIDIVERHAWETLADERTRYLAADLATDRPFEPEFFDRVISFTVFEHVEHPYAELAELYRVMKPGGLAYIKANLHRGPMASHRYRWVYFPHPHLLFDDDVFREYCRRHGMPESAAAWVNRLTWSEYERHFERIGFRIRMLRFSETPLDEAFYRRFESILGRYPRTDLTRDFFEVVLEKPARSRLSRMRARNQ